MKVLYTFNCNGKLLMRAAIYFYKSESPVRVYILEIGKICSSYIIHRADIPDDQYTLSMRDYKIIDKLV